MLYNSLYFGNGEMLTNQHIHGIAAAYAPVLHLRRQVDDGIYSTYVDSFERVWDRAATVASQPGARTTPPARGCRPTRPRLVTTSRAESAAQRLAMAMITP